MMEDSTQSCRSNCPSCTPGSWASEQADATDREDEGLMGDMLAGCSVLPELPPTSSPGPTASWTCG